jgi:hypothetical protein
MDLKGFKMVRYKERSPGYHREYMQEYKGGMKLSPTSNTIQ